MPLSEKDYLTQMQAIQQSQAALSRQFVLDNPESDYTECAEEFLEDGVGWVALLALWLEVYFPAAAKSVTVKLPKTGVVKL